MQFWNSVGMGTLSGMMMGSSRGIGSRGHLDALGARIGVGRFAEDAHGDSPFDGSVLMGKAPPFPSSSMDRLRSLMFAHMQARENATNEFAQKLNDMKEKFFESHSYQTAPNEEGQAKVLLNEQGQPTLMEGGEDAMQRASRQEFEASTRQALSDLHTNEKETFLQDEKQQIMNFLQNNRNELGNPSVQSELQKMILLTQKKALNLQRTQEEEIWKVDLPTDEMRAQADDEMQKLRKMDDEHQNVEDASREAQELIMYQEEVNAFLRDEKEKLQFQEKDEVFLKGPDAFLKPPPAPPLSSVLPPYLTEALYNMGIYSID
ncbi:MAG: hypothetical protein RDV48_03790 [Candidatus Eremiobacteraeota bacterium]|nr:hypothetical protein [Candidatus Eremiobacteraeota bacterium]